MSNIGSKSSLGKPYSILCSNLSVKELGNLDNKNKLPQNAIIISSPQTYIGEESVDKRTPAIVMTDSTGSMLPLSYTLNSESFWVNTDTNTVDIKTSHIENIVTPLITDAVTELGTTYDARINNAWTELNKLISYNLTKIETHITDYNTAYETTKQDIENIIGYIYNINAETVPRLTNDINKKTDLNAYNVLTTTVTNNYTELNERLEILEEINAEEIKYNSINKYLNAGFNYYIVEYDKYNDNPSLSQRYMVEAITDMPKTFATGDITSSTIKIDNLQKNTVYLICISELWNETSDTLHTIFDTTNDTINTVDNLYTNLKDISYNITNSLDKVYGLLRDSVEKTILSFDEISKIHRNLNDYDIHELNDHIESLQAIYTNMPLDWAENTQTEVKSELTTSIKKLKTHIVSKQKPIFYNYININNVPFKYYDKDRYNLSVKLYQEAIDNAIKNGTNTEYIPLVIYAKGEPITITLNEI